MTASGFGIYIAVTFIPWIGLSFRIYDILKGNYDPKEDPKILTLLGVWAIGFTFIWICRFFFCIRLIPFSNN